MNKYKTSFLVDRKLRVEDSKTNIREFEAENITQAFEKVRKFVDGFYGSRVQIIKINIEEVK